MSSRPAHVSRPDDRDSESNSFCPPDGDDSWSVPIIAIANRVGDRWADAIAKRLAGQIGDLFGPLASALGQPKGANRDSEVKAARSALEAHICSNPDASKALVDATLQTPPSAWPIEQYSAFLDTCLMSHE
jgi:hypothetical protein